MTPRHAGLRLLVVDDEEPILELLELTLTMKGYHVLSASSGPEALSLARAGAVDLIVMDVLMAPWDGFETVRQLHRHLGQALPPVVFLSGLGRPERLPELAPAVTLEYLLKPFRPSELVEAIDRVWERSGAGHVKSSTA